MKTSFQKEALLVIVIALAVTVMTTANFFTQLIRTPSGHVFVGMTHYFEDFYYYLDQFYQGAHGGWLTENHFTTEDLKPTLIYIDNILLGKLGGLFKLESFTSYNLSLLILKYLFIMLSYYVLMQIFPNNKRYRLFSFLIFIFSTSLPVASLTNGNMELAGPLRVFRAENVISSRFANIPNMYVINILFLGAFILIYRLVSLIQNSHNRSQDKKIIKYLFWLVPVMILLTLSDAVKSSILILVCLAVMWVGRPSGADKKYFYLCLLIITVIITPFLFTGLYLAKTINADPVYQQATRWDIGEYYKQFSLMKLKDYFINFGLGMILFFIGLPLFASKKKNLIEQMVLIMVVISFTGYILPALIGIQIPIPGFRFVFSSTYIFAAVIVLYGFLTIEKLLKKKTLSVLLFIFLAVNLITYHKSFANMIKPPVEPYFHFTYFSKDLYEGLLYLRELKEKDIIVLANPDTSTDLFIPGLTGKRTYTGHFLTTLNSAEKDKLAHQFFYEWNDTKTALDFLKSRNIKYIFLTKYSNLESLKEYYPFLEEVFKNGIVTIYTYR